ncbi:unnamed protein product [Rhizophagus irregularis]|nr:unnamed protein product [Rhizophagus irregularis]
MHKEVALKCLHNSQNITTEFLREIELLLILAANKSAFITDVGLCQPANMKISQEDNAFGVLPYVAAEVLRGGVYTQL